MRMLRIIFGVCSAFVIGFASFSFAQMGSGGTPAASGGSAYVPSSGGGSDSTSGSTTSSSGGSTSPTGGSTPSATGGGSDTGSTASAPSTDSGDSTSGLTTSSSGGSTSPTGGSTPPPTDGSGTGNTVPSSSGNPAPAVSDSSGGSDAIFNDFPDSGGAYGFQNEVDYIRKQKKKKTPKPVSVFGKLTDILRISFTGPVLGANWRIGGTATDPTAQGTLTGKGSLLRILIGLYTGSVYAQLDSRTSHWVASFYSAGDAQRSELYSGKAIYQEETTTDADGAPRKLGLLLAGKTLFGAYEDGIFFVVDAGTMPDAAPNANAAISIPQSTGPLIPTQKIIELLTKAGIAARDAFVSVAYAATRALTPSQTFDGLTQYKKVKKDMTGIEEKFSVFNFDDPNVDWDAAQELVDAYDAKQNQLYFISNELGWRGQPFVRDGAWLSLAGPAAAPLFQSGVPAVPAIFMSEFAGPFDFYSISSEDGARAVLGGSCTGRNNANTGEEVVCVMRRVSAAQARAILDASDRYGALAEWAHGKLDDIEATLFASAE